MKTVTILAIASLIMAPLGAGLVWTHSHGAEKQVTNENAISSVKFITASALRTNRDIRDLDKECHDLNMKIERKRSDLIQIRLSPNKDPQIIEWRNRIKREIEDHQRELEKKEKDLRDKQIKESKLIEHIASA